MGFGMEHLGEHLKHKIKFIVMELDVSGRGKKKKKKILAPII